MTTADERADAVLDVLRGAPPDRAAARLGVDVAELAGWVDAFVAAGRRRLCGLAETESYEARDRFLVLIAHEFRTPLTTIGGWVETLLDDRISPEVRRRAIEIILKQVAHLERTARDAVDAGALARGQLRLVLAPVELRSLIAGVAAYHRAGMIALEDGCPVTVLADGPRMEQVVGDVLAHAVRLGDGLPVHVALDLTAPATVTVTFTVEGRTLAPGDAAELFEPFRRSDTSVGTGLGLYLCRALLGAHGGEIGAGAGAGATDFWFRLPRQGPHPGPLVDRR